MGARKRGLGRGLEALLEDVPPPPAPRAEVSVLPVGQLTPNRLQPRTSFDSDGLAELTASIEAQGVVQPIVVTPRPEGGYTIVAGERRWRAARQAELEEVPVVVRTVESDRELLELALVENLQRSDLNPIEEAEAYERLASDFSLSHEAIAGKVGKSRAAVSNAIRLLGLPSEVQELLRQGELTAGQARPLLTLGRPKQQVEMARKIVKLKLSARQVESRSASKRPKPQLDPDTRAAADALTRALQTKVEIRRRGKGGVVMISFHSEEELIRLYERLTAANGAEGAKGKK